MPAMRIVSHLSVALFAALFGAWLQSAPEENEHLKLGTPTRNEKLLHRTGFVTLHDNTRKIPLWAAYHLTPADITNRKDRLPATAFAADADLPENGRAELSDYRRSGFDRGHMVPSGDMRRADPVQAQSFLLSNIVPQDSFLNQHPWKALEDQTREWVMDSQEAYIYVGPIPGSNLKTVGKGRVVVPEALYKIVAIKRADKWHAIGFVCENSAQAGEAADWITRIADIELLTGFRFLSALPADEAERLKERLPKSLKDW